MNVLRVGRTALFLLPLLAAIAHAGDTLPVDRLFAGGATLPAKIAGAPKGWTSEPAETGWHLAGRAAGPVAFRLQPATNGFFDFSAWNYARVAVRNEGAGLLWIEARLENEGAQDWTRCAPGSAIVQPGETATVGFAFTRPEAEYRGPALFKDQYARPDGFRTHWRTFDAARVQGIRLLVRSSNPEVLLQVGPPVAAWPADPALASRLHALPYLDRFGQVDALSWPGKATAETELAARLSNDLLRLRARPRPDVFDRFGGWASGPQREATGWFRTEKIDGRWWLVDPDGHLFWSAGACCVGWEAATPLTKAREAAGFFAWLPPTNDPLAAIGLTTTRDKRRVNFPAMNLRRAFGEDWVNTAAELTHLRMQACGINTLGAWSSTEVARQQRTPYTLTTGTWWPLWKTDDGHVPEPFDPAFTNGLRKSLEAFAWAKDDPWCLGVFIDNELEWPDDFTGLFLKTDANQPGKRWAVGRLQEKHHDIDALNRAWGTELADWDALLKRSDLAATKGMRADMDALYLAYARAYFAACRSVLHDVLPHRLYLGCRTHRGPPVLGRAAQGLVDVFSVNSYERTAVAHQVQGDADLPVLAGEFHFGAIDRGVPGQGLRSVHDQVQRGRAYAGYLAGALRDPRFVGVHWFQWLDQSAAGRPGENYQVGFVDVAGNAYPEFSAIVGRATERMYPARAGTDATVEQTLAALLAP